MPFARSSSPISYSVTENGTGLYSPRGHRAPIEHGSFDFCQVVTEGVQGTFIIKSGAGNSGTIGVLRDSINEGYPGDPGNEVDQRPR
eukprot:12865-Hanusia_phi.AAC.1